MNSLLIQSDSSRLWQACLERVSREVSRAAFAAWFAPLRLGEWEGETLQVMAPTLIAKEFVHAHHKGLIERILREEIGGEVQIRIVLDPNGMADIGRQLPTSGGADSPLCTVAPTARPSGARMNRFSPSA